MAEKFAKLFEFDDDRQVLVVREENDDGQPCVRFTTNPEGLGQCSLSPTWSSNVKGEKLADEMFANADDNLAASYMKKIDDQVRDFVG